MAEAALREFVLNHHRLGALSAQLRDARAARRAAKAHLLASVGGVSTALRCDADCVVVTITTPKRSAVSPTDLAATADALTPDEVRAAFESMGAAADMVPLRDVVSHAVLYHLRACRGPGAPSVKVRHATPKPEVPVLWVAADSPDWVAALAAAAPKGSLEGEAAALRARQRELGIELQGGLPGAAAPDFQRPLVVNFDNDQHRFLLRNRPTVKKPALNYNRLSQFLACAQNDQLDRLVSPSSIDYGDVCRLSRQLLPGVVTAIREWQAKHATVSVALQLAESRGK